MPVKLTYFNLRGRAEFGRLVLVQAGEEWEDVRVDQVRQCVFGACLI